MRQLQQGFATVRKGWMGVLFLLWGITWPLRSLALDIRPLNLGEASGPKLEAQEAAQRVKEALLAVKARLYTDHGMADYAAMRKSAEWRRYRQEAARLRAVDLHGLTTPEAQRAFWINIYNALVADAILTLDVRGSVLKTPDFFRRARYEIGGHVFSLDAIEHGLLRGNRPTLGGKVFKPGDPRLAFALHSLDPRIHFALNCGARSCPPVGVYDAAQLDRQLDLAARNFINGPDVQIDAVHNIARISQLFQWYAADFGPDKRDPLRFIARYLHDGPAKAALQDQPTQFTIRYLPYDWSLNGVE